MNFRGSAPAKIDDKGRLKVPTDFRRQLEDRFGPEVFLTSVEGDSVQLYPLAVWEEIEARLLELPWADPLRQRFLERVSFYGLQTRLDSQGRVLIPQLLREGAEMNGEVVVSGRLDHFVIWNRERIAERMGREPFTREEYAALSELMRR